MAEPAPTAEDEDSPALVRAALLGLIALLAGLVFLAVAMARTVVPEVIEDGPLARERLSELLPMTLPPGFEPAATLDWDLLRLIPMRGVWCRGEAGGEITLLRLGGRVAEDEGLRRRAAEALAGPDDGRSEVESSVPMTVQVRGREETVPVLTLRDRGGQRTRRFHLAVPTDAGPVLIEWRQPEAAFDAEVVRRSLASIR